MLKSIFKSPNRKMVGLSSTYFRNCPSEIQLRNPRQREISHFCLLKIAKSFWNKRIKKYFFLIITSLGRKIRSNSFNLWESTRAFRQVLKMVKMEELNVISHCLSQADELRPHQLPGCDTALNLLKTLQLGKRWKAHGIFQYSFLHLHVNQQFFQNKNF